jgi:hypothetical protein
MIFAEQTEQGGIICMLLSMAGQLIAGMHCRWVILLQRLSSRLIDLHTAGQVYVQIDESFQRPGLDRCK